MTAKNRAPRPHVYRSDVDGLRAVAVLGVIAFHAFPALVPGGFVGVDIFFVISGYLITGIILENLDQKKFTFADFYMRRVRRIFPALALVLAATCIAGWSVLMADEYKALGKNVAAGAAFIANVSLWKESGYFDVASNLKPLLHLWSLGVEEQFYILWPMFLYLAAKQRLKLIDYIFAIGAASFLVNIVRIEENPSATFFLPASRFWELMSGSLLASWEHDKADKLSKTSALWTPDTKSTAGLFLLLLSLFLIDESMPYPGWRAVGPVLGAALIIAAGPEAAINRFLLASRFAVCIGLISYPLYLWHWPLLAYARIMSSGEPSAPAKLKLIALAFFLAWATYEYVEKKTRAAFSRDSFWTISTLASLMIVMMLAGTVIWYSGGFGFRFKALAPFETFAASEASLDWQRDRCFVLPSSPLDGAAAFDEYHCVPRRQRGKFSILLVGDSHAADLYADLVDAFKNRATVGQLTAGFCVSMIEDVKIVNPKDGTARCRDINHYIFDNIRKTKPDVVVIGGNYFAYDTDRLWAYPGFLASMTEDINNLAAEGISIVIVGQSPTWTAPLPKIVERIIINKQPVPERMKTGLDEASLALDKRMQGIPWNVNVTYVSMADHMCDAGGCLISTGTKLPEDLLFIDQGHYSATGARYVMNTVLQQAIEQRLQVKPQGR